MAEPWKNSFGAAVVREIGTMLRTAHPAFPEKRFVAQGTRGLGQLELMDRARHIAAAMKEALPDDFAAAAEILVASLGVERERAPREGMTPFVYLPHVLFVGEHGVDAFEPAMRAQYELTKRFTAEFSIRRFLERQPTRTLARLRVWARDPNEHVRRLVSEGTRPRLPWAPRLRAFQLDPAPVLALLDLLKDDPSLYVRRSVANNLNDIGKDHPDRLVEVCRRWARGAGPERRWVIRHALRWLVKRGHPGALAVLGFDLDASLAVTGRVHPRRVRIGGTAVVDLHVENRGPRPCAAAVDVAVHFVKSNGKARAKVFKGRNLRLDPGAKLDFAIPISFAVLSTRKPHPGRHIVEARVNGSSVPVGELVVTAAPKGPPPRRS